MTASNTGVAVIARRIRWKPAAAFALIVAIVAATGMIDYVHQRKQFRQQTADALNAIADLKVAQLENWREERLSDARVLAANPFTVAALQTILKRQASAADESNARGWLTARLGHLSYSSALLLDATGGVRIAVGRAEGATDAGTKALIEEAVRVRKPVLSDFHMPTPRVPYNHLDLVIPICDLGDPGLPPDGFVLYHIDPELFLYPFIQAWPTPSRSGESLLVRRDGSDVLFLNELRGRSNTALRLRVPLSNTALPAALVVLGKTGIVEGLDYNEAPVVAALRGIPGTPWYLVAKMDAEEVLAPLRVRALFTVLFGAGAILAGGVLLAFLMKRRQAAALRTQLDTERELAAIYENAPLMMLLVDEDRRVRKMNRFAEQFAGAARGGQVGMRGGEALHCLHALDDPRGCGFGPSCEHCVIRRVVTDTLTTGAQHTQVEATLATSDQGREKTFTVLVSTSWLDSHGHPMALVAMQDISERKQAEEKLRFQNLILSTQQDAALDGILVVDEHARIVSYNRLFVEMMGIPYELVEQNLDEPVLQFITNQMADPQRFLRKVKYLYEHREEISQDELLLKNGRRIDRYAAPLIGHDKQYYGRIWFFRDVTESKRAEEALHESEARHRLLFESSHDAIMTLAPPTWRFTAANPAMIEMFRTNTVSAFLALEPWKLSPERQPDGRLSEEKAREMIETAVREGSNFFEWTHRRLDGKDFSATVLLSRMQVGGETILQATVRDITESKQAQDALAERARTDAFGAEVGRALVEPAPLPDILQACCESAVKHLGGSFARIWVFNPDDQVLELRASAGLYTHIDGAHGRIDIGKFKIGRIAQTRQPHLTNQVIGDPEVADQEWARREGMVSFAGYPLLMGDRLIGVMAMFAQHPLSELVLQAMAVVAYSIAVGIDRKRTEENLKASESKLSTITMSAKDGIIMMDNRGAIAFWNPAAEAMLGYSAAEARGRNVHELLAPARFHAPHAAAFPEWQKTGKGGAVGKTVELAALRKSGEELAVELSLNSVWIDGNWMAVGVMRDISARKELEGKIKELNEQLEQRVRDRTAQFEVSNRELETFAYSVSHDLRGPLRAIDGFSLSLMEDAKDRLSKSMMEDLVRVRKAAQRMARLIDSLLTLSRTTRQEMTTGEVDLSLIANEIALDLQKSDPSRAAEFLVTPGLVVNGDKQLLHVAIQNLLMNAWKFTRNCEQALIEFGVDLNDGKRVFFVRDNGAGFDMAYVNKLFGSFQRLHSEKEFEGTGIGLATVQRIIQRHGGTIRAEGMVGAGATFYFTI